MQFYISRKGYPHSMMRLAYFRMKFSSLKMKSERVLELPIPGRLMLVAVLAMLRNELSCEPPLPPSSMVAVSVVRLAILVKDSIVLELDLSRTLS